jgi:hypothetical protein
MFRPPSVVGAGVPPARCARLQAQELVADSSSTVYEEMRRVWWAHARDRRLREIEAAR